MTDTRYQELREALWAEFKAAALKIADDVYNDRLTCSLEEAFALMDPPRKSPALEQAIAAAQPEPRGERKSQGLNDWTGPEPLTEAEMRERYLAKASGELSPDDLATLDALEHTHPNLWFYVREAGQACQVLMQENLTLRAQRAPEPRYQGLREALNKLHDEEATRYASQFCLGYQRAIRDAKRALDDLERLAAAKPRASVICSHCRARAGQHHAPLCPLADRSAAEPRGTTAGGEE